MSRNFYVIILMFLNSTSASASTSMTKAQLVAMLTSVFSEQSNQVQDIQFLKFSTPMRGVLGNVVDIKVNGSTVNPSNIGIRTAIPCSFTDEGDWGVSMSLPQNPMCDGCGANRHPEPPTLSESEFYHPAGPAGWLVRTERTSDRKSLVEALKRLIGGERFSRQVEDSTFQIVSFVGENGLTTIELTHYDSRVNLTKQSIVLAPGSNGSPSILKSVTSKGQRRLLINGGPQEAEVEVTCSFNDLSV